MSSKKKCGLSIESVFCIIAGFLVFSPFDYGAGSAWIINFVGTICFFMVSIYLLGFGLIKRWLLIGVCIKLLQIFSIVVVIYIASCSIILQSSSNPHQLFIHRVLVIITLLVSITHVRERFKIKK